MTTSAFLILDLELTPTLTHPFVAACTSNVMRLPRTFHANVIADDNWRQFAALMDGPSGVTAAPFSVNVQASVGVQAVSENTRRMLQSRPARRCILTRSKVDCHRLPKCEALPGDWRFIYITGKCWLSYPISWYVTPCKYLHVYRRELHVCLNPTNCWNVELLKHT